MFSDMPIIYGIVAVVVGVAFSVVSFGSSNKCFVGRSIR